jgi:hypothetical protein
VQQRREPGMARSSRRHLDPVESGWQRCPALCPVSRLLARVVLRSRPFLRQARCLRRHRRYYTSIRHPASPLMAPVIPRQKRPPATTRRQKQGFLGSNAILACVMWPSTPAEWRSLAIAAPRIWPSTAVTVSASAISRITWLIPTPHSLTVYASAAPLPDAPATLVIGRLARPYPSGTFPRRIALTSPSARRLRRNRQAADRSTRRSDRRRISGGAASTLGTAFHSIQWSRTSSDNEQTNYPAWSALDNRPAG